LIFSAEQQGAVAEEINRNELNVRDITEQAQTASEQTSTASLELAGLGNSLQGQVRRFQLCPGLRYRAIKGKPALLERGAGPRMVIDVNLYRGVRDDHCN